MQVYATDAIRNVVLLSHGGAGKTTLAEAMLHTSGAISRMGRVEEGTTTTDYEQEEIERRTSVSLAIAPCEVAGVKLNLIDVPGYADFSGDAHSGIAAADCAAIVVSAVDGVEVGTEAFWKKAEAAGLPRLIVVNKMDRENADFFRTLTAIQSRLGRQCVPVFLPQGAVQSFSGVTNLLNPADLGKDPRFAEFRDALTEVAAEADDALTEKYLEKGGLEQEDLQRGVKLGLLKGTLCPVLVTAALKEIGVREALDFLGKFAPSPGERPAVEVESSGKKAALSPKSGPAAALVFKTSADPYVGKLSYVRVVSGVLKSDSQVWNAAKGQQERIGQVFIMRGKHQEPIAQLSAGDIGAIPKLQHTSTGETLCARESPVAVPMPPFPGAIYSVAIAPKTKADMDKMGAAVTRLVEEDPSLHFSRDPATGESVLGSQGDAHIDVAVKKLKRKFGVDVLTSVPRVPYRESIASKTVAEYRHRKQSGGHGQYGHVVLEIEPQPRGAGVAFEVKVVGGSVPKEFIPAVEKGVMEAVHQGPLSGNPIVDVKVVLTDGSSHPVDSSGMAFQIAAIQCLKKGIQQATPVILEPIMSFKITVPDSATGDVMGDLNAKRGRVLGMNPEGGYTTVEAMAPLAEMQKYAITLRSMTQGRGVYAMAFDHYEPVPAHLAQKIIAASAAQHAVAV